MENLYKELNASIDETIEASRRVLETRIREIESGLYNNNEAALQKFEALLQGVNVGDSDKITEVVIPLKEDLIERNQFAEKEKEQAIRDFEADRKNAEEIKEKLEEVLKLIENFSNNSDETNKNILKELKDTFKLAIVRIKEASGSCVDMAKRNELAIRSEQRESVKFELVKLGEEIKVVGNGILTFGKSLFNKISAAYDNVTKIANTDMIEVGTSLRDSLVKALTPLAEKLEVKMDATLSNIGDKIVRAAKVVGDKVGIVKDKLVQPLQQVGQKIDTAITDYHLRQEINTERKEEAQRIKEEAKNNIEIANLNAFAKNISNRLGDANPEIRAGVIKKFPKALNEEQIKNALRDPSELVQKEILVAALRHKLSDGHVTNLKQESAMVNGALTYASDAVRLEIAKSAQYLTIEQFEKILLDPNDDVRKVARDNPPQHSTLGDKVNLVLSDGVVNLSKMDSQEAKRYVDRASVRRLLNESDFREKNYMTTGDKTLFRDLKAEVFEVKSSESLTEELEETTTPVFK